jgi:hypothetical protein
MVRMPNILKILDIKQKLQNLVENKLHKDWFRHSQVNRVGYTDNRQHGDLKSLCLFFQNKESRLNIA